jgi:hypothetical protein
MCCFSHNVDAVFGTKIFARSFPEGAEQERQYIVYSMFLKASENLAMILPIPVKRGTGDDVVRFINLDAYPQFFDGMEAGFPPERRFFSRSNDKAAASVLHFRSTEVGQFEASYVPTVKDFSRLDERFRLPAGVWEKLPQYEKYGFAVFKLKPGSTKKHPMAFSFPRANPKAVFFRPFTFTMARFIRRLTSITCSTVRGIPMSDSGCGVGASRRGWPRVSSRSTKRRKSWRVISIAFGSNSKAI